MLGIWIGTYKHESKRLPEEKQNQLVKFELEIKEFDGVHFKGTVRDDLETGGTRGEGSVVGTLKNGKIQFIKKMPVRTLIYPNGTVEEMEGSHPNIYYKGILDQNGVRGVWKFRLRFVKIQGRWGLAFPSRGQWSMRKVEEGV